MSLKPKPILFVLAGLLAVLAVGGWWSLGARPSKIDPAAIAASETRMWQAYYAKDKQLLGPELTDLERNHYALTRIQATRVARHFGRAAMIFAEQNKKYEKRVLPELTRGYSIIKSATDADFDPQRAAKAELAWWVARRDPQHNSPQEVGHGIALLYAELYGGMRPEFEQAGMLRAQAASLRDRTSGAPDWPEIEKILRESYTVLVNATTRKSADH